MRLGLTAILTLSLFAYSNAEDIATPAAPVVEGRWLRPTATTQTADPMWGHADGLRVGIHTLHGPRGLLRIYAPYLNHSTDRIINFVAVEPIPAGKTDRGLSELEYSKLDFIQGKRFWSVDDPADCTPRPSDHPARGRIETIDGVECLRVFVQVEPFDNGASVYIRMTFRADRPHEVALATFTHDGSKPLNNCVLTATMGNYARIRNLQLADDRVSSLKLWPDYGDDGFTPHASFPLSILTRTPEGAAVAIATPNEADPSSAIYAPDTKKHWQYTGKPAAQSWRAEKPDPALQVLVNGRYVYWKSRTPIPGGVAFENFEMMAPFKQGQEFIFGVEPQK